MKSKLDDKSLDVSVLTPAGRKELKSVLSDLPAEDGDVEGAICRIDFSAFAAAPGSKNLTSATKLVVTKADVKRKRVAEEGEREDMASLAKHVRLPNGKVAFCFNGAKAIKVIDDTVIVEFADGEDTTTEAAAAEEAA
jgi:class 3 adenylate cyclase